MQEDFTKLVSLASECYGDPSKFWRRINNLRTEPTVPITYIINKFVNDDSEDSDFGNEITERITDPQSQANTISNYWKNIFKPHLGPEFKNPNVLKVTQWHTANKAKFENKPFINFAILNNNHPILRPIELDELKSVILTIKDKSPGPDGITAPLLKALPVNYLKQLINIYNSITSAQYWPQSSKTSNTKFILKPCKSPRDPASYRPIALINIISKILEKILGERLMYYLEYNNFFKSEQFGFRKNRSTQQELHIIQQQLINNKNENKISLLITRDISKAFDTVWHRGLLYKLKHHALLDDDTIALFNNYISNRVIIPHFNNCQGATIFPSAGVPQGSCLGPYFYLIQCNDMPLCKYYDNISAQFADDFIQIIRNATTSHSHENLLKRAEKELKIIYEWECNWRIKSNPQKCKALPLGCYIETLERLGGLVVNNESIELVSRVTILGFTITTNLTTTKHATFAANRGFTELNKLVKFREASPKIKKQLYQSLILPILSYPPIMYFNMNKSSHHKLQVIQNKALHFINSSNLKDKIPSKVLHEKFKLPPLNIYFNKLQKKCFYKMIDLYLNNNDEPSYLDPFYQFSEFSLSNDPIFTKKISLLQKIINISRYDENNPPLLKTLPEDSNNWEIPSPVFTI